MQGELALVGENVDEAMPKNLRKLLSKITGNPGFVKTILRKIHAETLGSVIK
jgi:hypothetical protein